MPPIFFNISFAGLFAATVLYIGSLVFSKKESLILLARFIIIFGVISLSLYMGLRWQAAGRPPFSNMFESLVVFGWATAIVSIFIDLRYGVRIVAALGVLMSLLAIGGASLFDKEMAPLLPALKSNWLTIHVLTCFIGYAALTVSFVAGAVLLLKKNEDVYPHTNCNATSIKKTIGVGVKLDIISYKMVLFGFLFLALGIVSGAVWANSAWGTYWSWDPKETWSLITWFVYAIYLHVRMRKGWKGRRAAWLSVAGFLAMLFTYFGVNYLLAGLHSYAG